MGRSLAAVHHGEGCDPEGIGQLNLLSTEDISEKTRKDCYRN